MLPIHNLLLSLSWLVVVSGQCTTDRCDQPVCDAATQHGVEQLRDKVMELEEKVEKLIQNDAAQSYRDCTDVPDVGDGVYSVHVPGDHVPKHVFCDQTTAGGGWLVFQRRMDGYENFQRNWHDYASGFGNINAEFWLGNDLLSSLTSQRNYKLRIDLEDFDGDWRYAEYGDFHVDHARNRYKITLGNYSGNAGDAMGRNRGQYFSTAERDFDTWEENCASAYKGGWWYESCHNANLNGAYLRGAHDSFADGIEWRPWHGYYYSLKFTEMKIKPML